jgi:hypothetical protein
LAAATAAPGQIWKSFLPENCYQKFTSELSKAASAKFGKTDEVEFVMTFCC